MLNLLLYYRGYPDGGDQDNNNRKNSVALNNTIVTAADKTSLPNNPQQHLFTYLKVVVF